VRLAVLSDIHANLAALSQALRRIDRLGADAVVCLGDIVGYGPDPEACVELVRSHTDLVVLGNHDEAVAFDRDVEYLPKDGQAAARLHQTLLSEDDLAWLRRLPYRAEAYGCTFVHASPDEPEAWNRLDSYPLLQAQFAAFSTPVCFVGHSHRPAVASASLGVHKVKPGHRFLVDVGSVGQPRDQDPRLSFALFDTEAVTCEIVREHYDVEATVQRLRERKLPKALAKRLRQGT